jgi:hypothetical protein
MSGNMSNVLFVASFPFFCTCKHFVISRGSSADSGFAKVK